MQILSTIAEAKTWRCQQQKIAFTPTMGALHAGHLALIDTAKSSGFPVVVSIFVNPTQFNEQQDLQDYPRPITKDHTLLKKAGVTALFQPDAIEIYPKDHATTVRVSGFDTLCGESRPGHFDGVATIITKLFTILQPTEAYFGEKDYQQLQLIKRLVTDLHMGTEVIGVPTVREADGLALSSRNVNLTPTERQQAAILPHTLQQLAAMIQAGKEVLPSIATAKEALLTNGFHAVDYLEVVDEALRQVMQQPLPAGARVVAAARIGAVRLIDNIRING